VENSPPQPRRGCGAQRHWGGVIAVVPLLVQSLSFVRTTPTADLWPRFPLLVQGGEL